MTSSSNDGSARSIVVSSTSSVRALRMAMRRARLVAVVRSQPTTRSGSRIWGALVTNASQVSWMTSSMSWAE